MQRNVKIVVSIVALSSLLLAVALIVTIVAITNHNRGRSPQASSESTGLPTHHLPSDDDDSETLGGNGSIYQRDDKIQEHCASLMEMLCKVWRDGEKRLSEDAFELTKDDGAIFADSTECSLSERDDRIIRLVRVQHKIFHRQRLLPADLDAIRPLTADSMQPTHIWVNELVTFEQALVATNVARYHRDPLGVADRFKSHVAFVHSAASLPSKRYINASVLDFEGHHVRFVLTQSPLVDDADHMDRYRELLAHYDVDVIVRLGDNLPEIPPVDPSHQVLHFREWPDHGVPPKNDDDFKNFHASIFQASLDVAKALKPRPTVVVHCLAGVGRTGVFVAYDLALHRGAKSKADVVNIIREMRCYRSSQVYSPGLLRFLFQALQIPD
jgi:hypothetical protein